MIKLKPVSSFAYAIMEAANTHGNTTKHTQGIRPMTRQEEIEKRNENIKSQLEGLQVVKPNGDRVDIDVDEVFQAITNPLNK